MSLMAIKDLFGNNAPFNINANIRINRFDGWTQDSEKLTTIWEGYGNDTMPPYECWNCQIIVMNVTDDGVLEIEFDRDDTDYNPQ